MDDVLYCQWTLPQAVTSPLPHKIGSVVTSPQLCITQFMLPPRFLRPNGPSICPSRRGGQYMFTVPPASLRYTRTLAPVPFACTFASYVQMTTSREHQLTFTVSHPPTRPALLLASRSLPAYSAAYWGSLIRRRISKTLLATSSRINLLLSSSVLRYSPTPTKLRSAYTCRLIPYRRVLHAPTQINLSSKALGGAASGRP